MSVLITQLIHVTQIQVVSILLDHFTAHIQKGIMVMEGKMAGVAFSCRPPRPRQ